MIRIQSILLCLWVLLASILVLGCEQKPASQQPRQEQQETITLRVAAASDLLFVFDALAQDFTTRAAASASTAGLSQAIKLSVTFGSSGNFVSQIRNKAPFDLFLSADLAYPNALVAEDLVLSGTIIQYATGHLALWWTQATPPTKQTLLDPAIKTIAIANPAHAPYGRAAVEALTSLGMYNKVKDKLVYGDNAAHAFQFAQSAAADIGVVPYSMVIGQAKVGRATSGSALLLSPETLPSHASLHAPIIQGACVLKATQHSATAQAFLEYLTTPEARAILKDFGFATPAP